MPEQPELISLSTTTTASPVSIWPTTTASPPSQGEHQPSNTASTPSQREHHKSSHLPVIFDKTLPFGYCDFFKRWWAKPTPFPPYWFSYDEQHELFCGAVPFKLFRLSNESQAINILPSNAFDIDIFFNAISWMTSAIRSTPRYIFSCCFGTFPFVVSFGVAFENDLFYDEELVRSQAWYFYCAFIAPIPCAVSCYSFFVHTRFSDIYDFGKTGI
jgi:hypothetical protein